MKKSIKNISRNLLKTELAIVYVNTNNKKFLLINDAIESEIVLQKQKRVIKKRNEIIMKITDILSEVLSKNDWGVFFKGEPLQDCPVQEGAKMYKVNEVNMDRLYDAINNELNAMEKTWEQNIEEKPTDNESFNG
tara:strand:- start:259 stop:663 length:405 start_codon:yes stop_codon:yes gene_type:complete